MAAIARAAIEPRAGMFMIAADEEEAVADLMADEAWLMMELIPAVAELMIELTVGLIVRVEDIVGCLVAGDVRYLYSSIVTGAISCLATPN